MTAEATVLSQEWGSVIQYILDYIIRLIKAVNFPVTILILVALYNKHILSIIAKLIDLIERGKIRLSGGLENQAKSGEVLPMEATPSLTSQAMTEMVSKKGLTVSEVELLSNISGKSNFSTMPIYLWTLIQNFNQEAIINVDKMLEDLQKRDFIIYDKSKNFWTVALTPDTKAFMLEWLRLLPSLLPKQ